MEVGLSPSQALDYRAVENTDETHGAFTQAERAEIQGVSRQAIGENVGLYGDTRRARRGVVSEVSSNEIEYAAVVPGATYRVAIFGPPQEPDSTDRQGQSTSQGCDEQR